MVSWLECSSMCCSTSSLKKNLISLFWMDFDVNVSLYLIFIPSWLYMWIIWRWDLFLIKYKTNKKIFYFVIKIKSLSRLTHVECTTLYYNNVYYKHKSLLHRTFSRMEGSCECVQRRCHTDRLPGEFLFYRPAAWFVFDVFFNAFLCFSCLVGFYLFGVVGMRMMRRRWQSSG